MIRPILAVLIAITITAAFTALHFYIETSRLQRELIILESKYNQLISDYNLLHEKYAKSSESLERLEAENNALKAAIEELSKELDSHVQLNAILNSKLNELERKYGELEQEYVKVQEEYLELLNVKNQYDHLLNISQALNSSLAHVASWLSSTCCIPEAFSTTLELSQLTKIAPFVEVAGVDPRNFWTSVQRIYGWIRRNVAYVHDIPLLAPNSTICDPKTTLCNYQFVEIQNYVQEPFFTAYFRQGDCDDQAILAYAMIKYYMIYVHRAEYTVWIAVLEMGSGMGHMAVFIPVSGGRLTIVDPAGAYLTVNWLGLIDARPALEELILYSQYWSEYGGIKHIELYEVDVRTGRYRLVIEGGVDTIGFFIMSATS